MEGGIDDVGLGVLFGLERLPVRICRACSCMRSIWRPCTAWARTPSACRASSTPTTSIPDVFDNGIDDDTFAKIVRLYPHCRALHRHDHLHPREPGRAARRCCRLGISQISGASRTSVGGYMRAGARRRELRPVRRQRPPHPGRGGALADGAWAISPSFCTACYREGRTGDRFMSLCKSRPDPQLLPSQRPDDPQGISAGLRPRPPPGPWAWT